MTFAFNNIKEETKCMGDVILNPSHHIQYIIKKYVTTNNTYKYVEFKEGTHYIFRTPDNLLYIIDESDLSKIHIASTKQLMDVTKLKENNIYNINAPNYSGLIQFKKSIFGHYYIFLSQTVTEKKLLISGTDIDLLDENEKKKLLELTFSIK